MQRYEVISKLTSRSTTGRWKIRKWGNECEVELEEWGCASEIKQILNKIKAAPCEMGREVRRSFRRILEKFWTFGRYRRDSEEKREGFWWKKGVRRVGLAYRELIGSLYESWTIGIERVYKKLTHNMIRRCKKWQKRGFETKERESSPRPFPRRGGM